MARAGYEDVVLLTGFPSFGARKVCERLVAGPEPALVHALVRPKFLDDARAAIDEIECARGSKIELIEGDTTSMDFGLSGAEFKALSREVDRIHHCAQISYLGSDSLSVERVNVTGAREALSFAKSCGGLKCLIFHSSAHVSGDRVGTVLESDLQKGQRFRNSVEESKARAEKLMRAAMPRIPIAVVRPSIVIGDSVTGEIDRFDGPYLLILLIMTAPPDVAFPLLGRGDYPLNMVPIDYVARAACTIGRDPRAPGKTFHIVDPAPLTARHVFELVARVGGRRVPRGFIPANLTKALLKTPGLERFAKSPRAFIETLVTNVSYNASNADALLRTTDIRCPPFEGYVERLIEYVQQRLKERRAKREIDVTDPLS